MVSFAMLCSKYIELTNEVSNFASPDIIYMTTKQIRSAYCHICYVLPCGCQGTVYDIVYFTMYNVAHYYTVRNILCCR